jgi:hypothetical protein
MKRILSNLVSIGLICAFMVGCETNETYTAVFRDKTQPPAIPEIKTWRLNIPSKVIQGSIGNPDAINGDGEGFNLSTYFTLNQETMEVDRFTKQSGWTYPQMSLAIVIGARRNRWPMDGMKDLCLDREDMRAISGVDLRKKYNPPKKLVRDCQTPFCELNMTYMGWAVDITIDQALYAEKYKYCALVKTLLDNWTISVDQLVN